MVIGKFLQIYDIWLLGLQSDISQNLVIFQREVERWKCNTLDTLLYHKRNIMLRIDGIKKSLVSWSCSSGLIRLEKKLLNELENILKKERVDVVLMFKDEIVIYNTIAWRLWTEEKEIMSLCSVIVQDNGCTIQLSCKDW